MFPKNFEQYLDWFNSNINCPPDWNNSKSWSTASDSIASECDEISKSINPLGPGPIGLPGRKKQKKH